MPQNKVPSYSWLVHLNVKTPGTDYTCSLDLQTPAADHFAGED